MLKVFLGFLVSVVVLLSSAYVPQTYATSATVLMTHIQAGGSGAATQEYIVLYNNSNEDVDITGWCLKNKNNIVITCFEEPVGQARYLPAHKHAVVVSSSMSTLLSAGSTTIIYAPISQSSGSIIGGSDTISLVDHTGLVIDQQSWTASITGGMQFERRGSGAPALYQDTDSAADWLVTPPGTIPISGIIDETTIDITIIDVCPNIDAVQMILPVGKVLNVEGVCVDRIIIHLDITEILPNAIGSDDGNEFIELYNPNNFAVTLSDYTLYVGPQLTENYHFPLGSIIDPLSYKSFSNSDIHFSFLNTASRALIALQDGTIVSEVPLYDSPKEGRSWAFADDQWQYTAQPTPGFENSILNETDLEDMISTQQPCAINQYRSPETNRCRLLSTLGKAVTPCKDGQYRSEETNRCRNISSDAKTVTPCDANEVRNPETQRCRKITVATSAAPCKAGQERNPDTNRCRTVTKMPDAGYGVLGAETTKGGNMYVVAAVGGILLLALGYAVWEWHDEIGKYFRKIYLYISRFVRVHK